jgi:hypothetical protein
VLLFFEIYFELGNTLYKRDLIKLPKPEFYMLYNGKEAYPPTGTMRLSEAFEGLAEGEEPALELVVNVININYDLQGVSLSKSNDLNGYALFVEMVRTWESQGKDLREAIRLAMDECLAKEILTEFFMTHKEEVYAMFSLVYDEDKAKEIAREEGREEGMEIGREEGMEVGREKTIKIISSLQKGLLPEEIAKAVNVPIEQVNECMALLSPTA